MLQWLFRHSHKVFDRGDEILRANKFRNMLSYFSNDI